MRHCPNSAAEAEYAHQQGLLSEEEAELEKLEAQMLETLEAGHSVWIDIAGKGYEYDASTILAERPGKPIYDALKSWCLMHSLMRLDHLRRINAEAAAEQALEDAA